MIKIVHTVFFPRYRHMLSFRICILQSNKFSFHLKIRDTKSEIWCKRWCIGGLRFVKKSQMSARQAPRSNIASILEAINCPSFPKKIATHVHTHGRHMESFLYCENKYRCEIPYCCSRLKRLETTLRKTQVECFCRSRLQNHTSYVDRFLECLTKRYEVVLSFRDNIYNRWYLFHLSRSRYPVNYVGIILWYWDVFLINRFCVCVSNIFRHEYFSFFSNDV